MAIPGFRGLPLREFAKRLLRRIQDDAVLDGAAQLAYYFLFALFPLMFFAVTLTAYLPLRRPLELAMRRLGDLLPAQSMQIIEGQLHSLLDNPRPKLLTVSLLFALWTASRALDGLRKLLNLAYRVTEPRSFLRTQWLAIWTTIVSSALVLLGFAMIILGGRAGHWLASQIGIGAQFATVWWSWLRWPTTALVIMLVASLILHWLPGAHQRFHYVSPGSVTSTLLWLVSTWGFSQFANNASSFNVTYGSLGAAIVLITWLYLSALVFILGGEVNAIIEQASPEIMRAAARESGESPEPRAPAMSAGTRRHSSALRARLGRLVNPRQGEPRPPQ